MGFICRIRKELKGFSTFLEIPRMQEEELFQQCADEADLLTKRIKLLYSVRRLGRFLFNLVCFNTLLNLFILC